MSTYLQDLTLNNSILWENTYVVLNIFSNLQEILYNAKPAMLIVRNYKRYLFLCMFPKRPKSEEIYSSTSS